MEAIAKRDKKRKSKIVIKTNQRFTVILYQLGDLIGNHPLIEKEFVVLARYIHFDLRLIVKQGQFHVEA